MVILKMVGYNPHSHRMSNLHTTGYDVIDVVGLKDEVLIRKIMGYARKLWLKDFGKDEVESVDDLMKAVVQFKKKGVGTIVAAVPKGTSLEDIASSHKNPLSGACLAEYMGVGARNFFVAEGYNSATDDGKEMGLHDIFTTHILSRADEKTKGKTVFSFVEADTSELRDKANSGYFTLKVQNALEDPVYRQSSVDRNKKTGRQMTGSALLVPGFKLSEKYVGKNIDGILYYSRGGVPFMTVDAAVKIVETVYQKWYANTIFQGKALELSEKANQRYLEKFKQRLENEAINIEGAPYKVIQLVPLKQLL